MDPKKNFTKYAISLIELFDRSISIDKQTNIYKNDVDNLYPNRIEIAEKNSKSANSCANKLGQYIFGKGFKNKDKEIKSRAGKLIDLNDCLQLVVDSVKTHRGAFIHLNFDVEGEVNYFDVLDYKKCRVSKVDYLGYSGNIIYKNWAEKSSIFSFTKTKSNEAQWFYPFNKKNVTAQRIKDAKGSDKTTDLVRNYRGQVLFFNLDNANQYPYAWLSGQAIYDADSEFRLALYRNNSIRKGFQDKTMFILNGFDKPTKENFDKTSKEWLGAENAGSVFNFSTPEFVEDPTKLIVPIQLKSSYDSKKFELDEKAFEDAIAKCYLDIPKVLINDQNGGVFGSSGSSIVEAQKLYSNGTKFLRDKFENLFYDIFDIENEILPLIAETSIDSAAQTRLQAQATLKGSVGGVDSLVKLVKSVALKEISKESAIEIIKEIYGVSEELAIKMIGGEVTTKTE
jgi:hypothetical protein